MLAFRRGICSSQAAQAPPNGFLREDFFARSLPTTTTSKGEVSGNKASRFSFGNPANDARIMSNCHVDDRYSASNLPTPRESCGVQWRGLYCKMANSGGRF